jgi:hypothetical protein
MGNYYLISIAASLDDRDKVTTEVGQEFTNVFNSLCRMAGVPLFWLEGVSCGARMRRRLHGKVVAQLWPRISAINRSRGKRRIRSTQSLEAAGLNVMRS